MNNGMSTCVDEFAGKTYMILGASSGIGKSLAYFLTMEKGCNVVLVARSVDKLIQLSQELPGNNVIIPYDLKDIENIHHIFDICTEKNVTLDGVVYSAGIAPLFSIKENDSTLMQETVMVNAMAFAEIGKCMLCYECVANNAAVVAVSSVVSQVVTNRQSAYAASKAMLNTYVKYLAREGINRIRVNGILPGAVETDMLRKMMTENVGLEERMRKYYPLGIIPLDRINKLITFLLSDDASNITGSLFVIDSGYSVCQ